MKRVHAFIDQYGAVVYARTIKELRERAGGGKVNKMYYDRKDGATVHCGYTVGRRWFSRFAPVEIKQQEQTDA